MPAVYAPLLEGIATAVGPEESDLYTAHAIIAGARIRAFSGASKGATTAFLLSTPQTGVDSILVTYSLLGPVFAVFRPIAALLTGLIGGAASILFDPEPRLSSAAKDADCPQCGCEDHGEVSAGYCNDGCCAPESGGTLRRAARYAFVILPADIGKPLLVGLAIAGLIAVIVPENFFAGKVGEGLPMMLLMMLVGIPMYVCATASVPIAAALILKGVSPGAALVFLIAGPGTNAATISTLWKLLGRRAAAIYLAVTALCALAFGYVLDFIMVNQGVGAAQAGGWTLPAWAKSACAVVLLAVIANALLRRKNGVLQESAVAHKDSGPADEKAIVLSVSGMTCSHCAESVRRSLLSIAGVESVAVDLSSGRAFVRGRSLDISALVRSLEEIGFSTRVFDQSANA